MPYVVDGVYVGINNNLTIKTNFSNEFLDYYFPFLYISINHLNILDYGFEIRDSNNKQSSNVHQKVLETILK